MLHDCADAVFGPDSQESYPDRSERAKPVLESVECDIGASGQTLRLNKTVLNEGAGLNDLVNPTLAKLYVLGAYRKKRKKGSSTRFSASSLPNQLPRHRHHHPRTCRNPSKHGYLTSAPSQSVLITRYGYEERLAADLGPRHEADAGYTLLSSSYKPVLHTS